MYKRIQCRLSKKNETYSYGHFGQVQWAAQCCVIEDAPLVTDWTIMERAKASEEVRKPGVAQ